MGGIYFLNLPFLLYTIILIVFFFACRLSDLASYEQDSKVQFVIDAVYAFANALQSLKDDLCPHAKGMCQEMKMVDGGYFYKNYLLKTSFIGMCKWTRQNILKK